VKFSIMFSFVSPPEGPIRHLSTFQELDRLLPLAESLGYVGFHTTEHHFQDNGWAPSPLLVLAKAAGLTEKMRLVTNILVSTLYQPLRLLEDLATLDNLSEGRLTLGTSPGYVSEEFAAYGVDYERRFGLHEEIIDFLQHGWANPNDIGFSGRFIKVPSCKLMPQPIQTELPIWYGVSGPKLLERAAKRRVPVTASPRHTLPELKDQFARYEEIAQRVGYKPQERPVIRECFVAKTTKQAEETAGPGVTHLFGLYGKKSAQGERALCNDAGELISDANQVDFRTFASRYVIGNPDVVKEGIEKIIKELSPSEINLRMQLPGISTSDFEQSLRLFAEEVMPEFQ
jgi:alkanesulfonate monooxygenase SsuD/methylene tetrahydromethanopterin reductase-like flavin-dependent oxidoreductase (luciferase family)